MKIADKIKYIIAHDQDVARRRAQLRALFYFHQKHPQKSHFNIFGSECYTRIDLMFDSCGADQSIGNLLLSPLSDYPNYSDK